MKNKDSQRQAVYNWENALQIKYPDSARDIGLDGAKALIELIYTGQSLKMPGVTDGRGRRKACYSPFQHVIKLPRWARSPIVVCHEVAHALAGPSGGWHRPYFATLLIDLWDEYAGVPQEESLWAGINQKPRKVHFNLTNAKYKV